MSHIEISTANQNAALKYADESARQFRDSSLARQVSASPSTFLVMALLLSDICAIAIGLAISSIISVLVVLEGELSMTAILSFTTANAEIFCLMCAAIAGAFIYGKLYQSTRNEAAEIQGIVCGIALVAAIDLTAQLLLDSVAVQPAILAAYPIIAVLVIGFRMILRGSQTATQIMTSNVVLVGNADLVDRFKKEFNTSRPGSVTSLRTLSFDDIAGKDAAWFELARQGIADENGLDAERVQFVLVPTPGETQQAEAAVSDLNVSACSFVIVHPFSGLSRRGVDLRMTTGAEMVISDVQPMTTSSLARAAKRGFDLIVCPLILILIAPVLVMLTALLALEKGPILYSQDRVGRDGRRFKCLKFRSMRPDAQEVLDDVLASDPKAREEWRKFQKLKNDPRITRVGHFLRKTSLDELPQLFNVLRGDMSLVGPRPIIAPEVSGYPSDRAYYDSPEFAHYARCTPGITGLWQISGRSSTSHDERIRLDQWYSRNMTLWLDLFILFRTVSVVLLRRGSS